MSINTQRITPSQPANANLTALANLGVGNAYQALQTNAGATAPQWGGYPVPTIGRPKISGGAAQWGIPGVVSVNNGTKVLGVNNVVYSFFYVTEPITILLASFEVTAAPASSANVRVGVTAADTDWQPTGAPLLDQAVAVGSGATGVFSTTAISIALAPGRYLSVQNCDVTMTVRAILGGLTGILPAMGSAMWIGKFTASQTYGAFPTPGTAWTTASGNGNGHQHSVVYAW